MRVNVKKVAFVALLAILFVFAGPLVLNLALGTDSVGVISAAYPSFTPGEPNPPGLSGGGGGNAPGLSGGGGNAPGLSGGGGNAPGLSGGGGNAPSFE